MSTKNLHNEAMRHYKNNPASTFNQLKELLVSVAAMEQERKGLEPNEPFEFHIRGDKRPTTVFIGKVLK